MEINEIIETLFKSKEQIPVSVVMMILGGIINTSKPDCQEVSKLCEILNKSNLSQEEVVSHTVMMACNSIVIGLHNYLNKSSNEKLDA
jgi:hypothetical protein